ncbi:restriction endonuclease PLD domain-containing protein [Natronorubrum thiooxidans]|uniref:PLD-like domain-containing protein n=1 Tax=Natronorubrum thiooxidans TaxID=308853 RepID=A0A1N7H8A4_9EURY|nr:restriction endonuclease PLD domain-containing protein [Natronorubrum thiooxidans]SIS21104.1 PLD-like domain-containing protein [Natronorubrum thiooxidans]
MEWTTDINLGGFGDGAEMRWETVKSWESFTDFFEDAVHIDAVTYCESPKLLLDLFNKQDEKLQTMDVLVGNREEYQSSVNDATVARQLERYYREEKLIVRLKNRKVVHSKLYRIVKPDDHVTLISGSANLSYNSWKNQTNSIVVFETTVDSQLDTRFQEWIDDHRESYANEIFMEDLAEELEQLDDEEEKERRIELWIDNRDTQLTEQGEVHSTVGKELRELGGEVDKVVGVTDDVDEADEVVTFHHEEIQPDDEREGEDDEETGSESGTSDGITAAKTPEYTVTLSTQGFESDGYVNQMETDLKRRGADVGSDAITTPVEGYTNYLETRYDVPKMWIADERGSVHLQHGERHRILTANHDPDPEVLDAALENIENYIQTVERWGETNNERAVMAHMYEAVLYGLWAPFINLYAQQFYGSVTLDNALQYLYIFGESDAGKDKFAEFVLRLISDDLVRGSADADDVGKNQIRALRNIDTVFPYVVSDISKQKIERIDTLRNFWEDSWHPSDEISYPAIIFTSNDSRPNDWFRNRTKMLHFDVAFPSNPEDEGFYGAQEDLNAILDVRNPIFSYVSQRILGDQLYIQADGTVDDVRRVFLEFYDEANREPPAYFPKEPANRQYNIGKRKWRQARERGDVTFERRDDHLIADFDLEPHELYSFRKTLPTKMRPEKSGRKIIIKNPDDFDDWLDTDRRNEDTENRKGFFNRLLRK